MSRIPTKDSQGNSNGWVLPVWNKEDGPAIDQVYVTAIAPGNVKGPHLHMKRRGLFCCVTGRVVIVVRGSDGSYGTHYLLCDGSRFAVQPGTPAALYNVGSEEAIVLNMPSPQWRPDDQDEWPVEGWDFKL